MTTYFERFKVKSWSELYDLGSKEIVRRIDEMDDLPVAVDDLLLTLTTLRAMGDLRAATDALNSGTDRLLLLTKWLVGLAALTLLAAIVTLIVAA